MPKCGCCGEKDHSVIMCTSDMIPNIVKLTTETLTAEEALEFIHKGLNTWQLTAILNYLDGRNPRHSKMHKHVKIDTFVDKVNQLKIAENSVRSSRPGEYYEFATTLYTRLSTEYGPITATTDLTVFRTIIRKAIESMIRRYTAYDMVRLVNQHFIWQCLPTGLHSLCQMVSIRYINCAFTLIQEEARMLAFSKKHLKNLDITVHTNKAATFQDTKECQICVDPDNTEFAQLNCGHVLCKRCVSDIAERREKSFVLCPYCREEIKEVEVLSDDKNVLQLELNTA
jgi:hypothetical protein